MKRANPVDLRRAIEVANAYVKAGILFVPIPVSGIEDFTARANEADEALERMAIAAEKGGA